MTIFSINPVSLASGLGGSPFALRIGLALLLFAADPVSPGFRPFGMMRTIVERWKHRKIGEFDRKCGGIVIKVAR
jgi:hypothetical protein